MCFQLLTRVNVNNFNMFKKVPKFNNKMCIKRSVKKFKLETLIWEIINYNRIKKNKKLRF